MRLAYSEFTNASNTTVIGYWLFLYFCKELRKPILSQNIMPFIKINKTNLQVVSNVDLIIQHSNCQDPEYSSDNYSCYMYSWLFSLVSVFVRVCFGIFSALRKNQLEFAPLLFTMFSPILGKPRPARLAASHLLSTRIVHFP